MQLANVIALLNPASSPTLSDNASSSTDYSGSSNSSFAQLLSNAQSNFSASDQQQQSSAPAMKESATIAAWIAQEVPANTPSDVTLSRAEMLAKPITPEEAAIALQNLQTQPMDSDLAKQLKAELTAIKDGASTQTVAGLIAKLSAAQPQTKQDDALLSYVAQLMKPASSEEAEQLANEQPNDKEDDLSGLLQSLQASLFRPVESQQGLAQTPTDEAQQTASGSQEIVVIEPLSATMQALIASTATAQSNVSQSDTVVATGENQPLDTMIPPLTVNVGANKTTNAAQGVIEQALPEVTLPTAVAANDNQLPAPSTANSAFVAMMKAIGEAPADQAPLASQAASMIVAGAETKAKPAVTAPAPSEMSASQPITTNSAVSKMNEATYGNAVQASAQTAALALEANNSETALTKSLRAQEVSNEATLADTAQTTAANLPNVSTAEITLKPGAIAPANMPVAYKPVDEQVHVAITSAMHDGTKQITIQLDPVDLGRVEVSMQTNSDGQTQISFMVDKPSTLDSLARSAHGLERSLQEAGVKADSGSMQFNLRQQPQTSDAGTGGAGGNNQQAAYQPVDDRDTTNKIAATPSIATRHYTLSVREGLDIRA